jgi:hypothetical protein
VGAVSIASQRTTAPATVAPVRGASAAAGLATALTAVIASVLGRQQSASTREEEVPPMHKVSSPSESSQPAPSPGRRTSVWRHISPASSEGDSHDDPPSDNPVNMSEPSADASLGGNRHRRRRPRRRQHTMPQSPDPNNWKCVATARMPLHALRRMTVPSWPCPIHAFLIGMIMLAGWSTSLGKLPLSQLSMMLSQF